MFDIEVKLINNENNTIIEKQSYTAIDYSHMNELTSILTEYEINMLLSKYPVPSTHIATSLSVNGKEILINESNNLTAQEERLSNVALQTVENVTFMINCVRKALKNSANDEKKSSPPPEQIQEQEVNDVDNDVMTTDEKLNRLRTLMAIDAEWSPDEYEFYCQCYSEVKAGSVPEHLEIRKILEGFVEII